MTDEKLHGIWSPQVYEYNGGEYELEGILVFTPKYLIANAVYDLTGDGRLDANANWGPYEILEPGKLRMHQKMQLHFRNVSPEDAHTLAEGDGTFLHRDVPEDILYTVDDDTLIFSFQVPGAQRWISKRIAG